MAVAGVAANPLKPARPAVIWQAGPKVRSLGSRTRDPQVNRGGIVFGFCAQAADIGRRPES